MKTLHVSRISVRPVAAKKYDPSQPRAPKGSPDGGQWTDDGGAAGGGQQQQQIKYRPDESVDKKAEEYAYERIKALADDKLLPTEVVEAQCAENLRKVLDAPLVVRSYDYQALKILDDGRFKTQFESGTSNGTFDTFWRARAESNGLGIPEDIDPAERPVYGYFDGGPYHWSSGYGSVKFVLKEEVKQRTTFTVGDSLGGFKYGDLTGSLISEPEDIGAWDSRIGPLYEADWTGIDFVEAQIHGGVTLKDVDYVAFARRLWRKDESGQRKPKEDVIDLERRLRAMGIEVQYHD